MVQQSTFASTLLAVAVLVIPAVNAAPIQPVNEAVKARDVGFADSELAARLVNPLLLPSGARPVAGQSRPTTVQPVVLSTQIKRPDHKIPHPTKLGPLHPSGGHTSQGVPHHGVPHHGVPHHGVPHHGVPHHGSPSHRNVKGNHNLHVVHPVAHPAKTTSRPLSAKNPKVVVGRKLGSRDILDDQEDIEARLYYGSEMEELD